MSSSSDLRVLAITAAPDDRSTTRRLELLLDEINRRPGHSAELWYLRHRLDQASPSGRKVVDDLRTWYLSRSIERVAGTSVAARIRGLRLRTWLRKADPDLVLLDDGLGIRVLDPMRKLPVIVTRLNPEPPDTAEDDRPFEGAPALRILVDGAPANGAIAVPDTAECRPPAPGAERCADAEFRRERRASLGLPAGGPLVTGWGDDGWLDGPDLFLRALWALHHRHGVAAHGAWFGLSADRHEAERLLRESERMGIREHFHIVEDSGMADRLCGDAVFLSYRDSADPSEVAAAVLAGPSVTAFAACDIVEPSRAMVRVVDDIDVEAAATALATGLAEDRDQRWRSEAATTVRSLLSVRRLVDDIVAAAPRRG